MPKLKFEDCLSIIEQEIQKRKSKWTLDAISWMDWEDVSQNIRIHIANKWEKWDQSLPLQPWLSAVIHNKIINSLRDVYWNCAPICNSCRAFDGAECSIYGENRDNCPLFTWWKKNKQNAYNIKLPLSSVYHEQEIHDMEHNELDIDKASLNIHEKMESVLKAGEFRIYSLLFVHHKTEEETVNILGFTKNKEKELYKIKQLKKKLIEKVKKIIYGGEIDIE